jgi:hypothetical protein
MYFIDKYIINATKNGLTRSVLEPTIYHTRGEHANHYTIDAVTIYDINPVTILLNLESG